MGKGKERAGLSVRERIILHIYGSLRRSGGRTDVESLTQTGIAEALNITRGHAAIELERGADKLVFHSQKVKMKSGRREVTVYLLTPEGLDLAGRLAERAASEQLIEEAVANPSRHSPESVFRELGDDKLILLCALRIGGPLDARFTAGYGRVPFAVHEDGKVRLSDVASAAVDRLLSSGDRMKLALSLLADHSLYTGNSAGRLSYLVASGRLPEAERHIRFHSEEIQASDPAEVEAALREMAALGGDNGELRLLLARTLLQLKRAGEALRCLAGDNSSLEWRLTALTARSEMEGAVVDRRALAVLKEQASTDRERSLLLRLSALTALGCGDEERAEREVVRAARIAARAGDVSELRLNYALLSRIERARGEYMEAARVESKLEGLTGSRRGASD